ncbi:MAG: hypothetical protein LBS55_05995 [Prevotellaceae bacterium]|jgi:DNA-binding transcriptional regulator YiaG|nr:hypothetical protein [Prevotellaceae bacterium]
MFAGLSEVSFSSVSSRNYVIENENYWTRVDFKIPEIFGWVISPYRGSSSNSETNFTLDESSVDVTSLAPSEQIKFIKEVMCLNMSQVAELFGVTRPTAYAWLDGRESGRGETAGKIMRLAVEVKKIENMDIPRIDLLIKRPIFGEKSMLDLLRECKDITEELRTLKKIGDKEETTRRNSVVPQSKKNISRMNEAIDELSMTVYFEESTD